MYTISKSIVRWNTFFGRFETRDIENNLLVGVPVFADDLSVYYIEL